jgi:hypothetical protein
MREIVRHEDIDLVLSYDEMATRVAICAMHDVLERLIPVKPGWVTSTSWSPYSTEFIVFSAEDLVFFRKQPKYKRVNFTLISGRVCQPVVDVVAAETLRSKYLEVHRVSKLALCPVRIERGKLFFIDSALRSFDAISQLDKNIALLIIGADQDPHFREELEDRVKNARVSICTDPQYTRNLSSILPAADTVFAMGRTVMEALLVQRRVFCPSGRDDAPLWEITPENFFAALSGNFTGRNSGRDLYLEIDQPKDTGAMARTTNFSHVISEHISAEKAVPKYIAAHQRSLETSPDLRTRARAFCFSRARLCALGLRLLARRLLDKKAPCESA